MAPLELDKLIKVKIFTVKKFILLWQQYITARWKRNQ